MPTNALQSERERERETEREREREREHCCAFERLYTFKLRHTRRW